MLFNASVEVFFNDKISTWIYLVKRKYVFEIDFCWFQNAKVLYNFWTKSRSAGHSGALNRYAYPLSRPWATVHRSTCQLLSNKEDRQYKKCIYVQGRCLSICAEFCSEIPTGILNEFHSQLFSICFCLLWRVKRV